MHSYRVGCQPEIQFMICVGTYNLLAPCYAIKHWQAELALWDIMCLAELGKNKMQRLSFDITLDSKGSVPDYRFVLFYRKSPR